MLRTVSGCSSQLTDLWRPGGPVAVDVAIVQVSAPGPDGRFSLGTSGGTTAELVRAAPLVLAEVNSTMPYTRGVVEFERSAFDALVEVDPPHPLIEFPSAPRSEVTDRIGANVGLAGGRRGGDRIRDRGHPRRLPGRPGRPPGSRAPQRDAGRRG